MRKKMSVTAGTAGRKLMRDVLRGFIRVHILHHAAAEPIFGLVMIEELRRHGYSIGAGTLYPMLHALEEAGALRSSQALVEGRNRRYYRTTKSGDALLAELRLKVREFVDEVLEESSRTTAPRRAGRRNSSGRSLIGSGR
jgi:PadR family transcriptional regulator, regulatory protein PadR